MFKGDIGCKYLVFVIEFSLYIFFVRRLSICLLIFEG
jgi:hypothetical protein